MTRTKSILRSQLQTVISTPNDAAVLIQRVAQQGEVFELSRGVFRRVDAPDASHPELLGVAHRAPVAVVCLFTAPASP